MTRRERIEARLEKRREWAAGREKKAAASFNRAHTLTDGIPFGQPILVGHHSEKRHRRTIEKADNAMRAGCESVAMAKHHESKASGLEYQLERSIFSDDPDAVEALEARIADLEANQARMKAENAAFKKGDAAWSALLGITLEQAAKRRETIMAGYSWCRKPHTLTNGAANVRRLKERLVEVKRQKAETAEAEAAPEGFTLKTGRGWAVIRFADYPGRETTTELKAAGFSFRGGSWSGYEEKLPDRFRAFGAWKPTTGEGK